MCLLTKEFPFINEEHINCYKIVRYINDEFVHSLYYDEHLYKLNELYGSEYNIKVSKDLIFYITNDFYHAYNELEFTKKKFEEVDKYYDKIVIVNCTIPKDSLCLKNEFEICLSNIIINNVLSI